MNTDNSIILTTFNKQFVDFVEDVSNIFPEDRDLLTAKNSLLFIKKANPKMIIKIWKKYIVDNYQSQIDAGDISFFINKDYGNDLKNVSNSDQIIDAINRLRKPIELMTQDSQAKTMKYIQNLTKLSNYYIE
jgi:accessory colonization factor AcfC